MGSCGRDASSILDVSKQDCTRAVSQRLIRRKDDIIVYY